MNTHIRLFSLAIVALGVLVSPAAAQQSPVLNALEVRMLVERGQPADHARLTTHFAALADRHAAEARQHTSMASAGRGNPNRTTGLSVVAHCEQIARLNNESAATLRELAAHHKTLAGGAASTAPRDGARFEQGAGSPRPTDAELSALAARASTPADHRALMEYFQTIAQRYETEAADHGRLSMTYRGTRIAQAADHCDRLVATLMASAKEARAAAAMHEGLARAGR